MASTDPAEEAARRVEDRDPIAPALDPLGSMVDAAREALGPIRKRHHLVHLAAQDATGTPATVCARCRDVHGFRVVWPCDDALDAYTSEELTRGDRPTREEFCEDLRVAINRNSVDTRLSASDFVIATLIAGLLDDASMQEQIARLQREFEERMNGLVRRGE